MAPKKPSRCAHQNLTFTPSTNAEGTGYKQPTLSQRIAATTPLGSIGSISKEEKERLEDDAQQGTFPAPLVLPEDELSWDPTYPPQSFRSWTRLKERNKVTPSRRTVYFAEAPRWEPGLEFLETWMEPNGNSGAGARVEHPKTGDVLDYLKAFYYGLPVKMLPAPGLVFTLDVDEGPKKRAGRGRGRGRTAAPLAGDRRTLWLNTNTRSGAIGIRTRPTPKGDFSHQLNLNDLLDAAIEILPDDAYALLMLVRHDIYDDEEDDFACGTAYGGSRVAVVSSARYNPILDRKQRVGREHAWPSSHCEEYLRGCCEDGEDDDEGRRKKKRKVVKNKVEKEDKQMPMYKALEAHLSLPPFDKVSSPSTLYGLWLARVCRTASHELGHCFGIDHCVYYACSMQGTASIIEDARQPPYLCPVDLAKVLKATGADIEERYEALLGFCEKHKGTHLFAAYRIWIKERLGELKKRKVLKGERRVEVIEID
ncbi:hypothetical protein BGZ60DRAFT_408603 [Tricladium varicosporioides]|nr:hypothetical protein BGZ60DRAFT_408603 [Hymenoscyphus varicosporioides]